ncbi:MAG: MFS transporter [Candidatus Zambryskibacteria bacterium]|nr:MFS transporter [Candidatus Zambryskibacteria bacterium]
MLRFVSVFVSVFFLSINFSAVLYVNSTLLSQFFTPETVSVLFVLGAVGNILLFLIAPKLIESLGKRLLLFIFLLLAAGSTYALAYADTGLAAATSFLVYSSVFFVIYYVFDIFLEEVSKDTRTGEIRGLYMTILNLGIMLGPVILALMVVGNQLAPVYIAATAILIPPILIAIFDLHSKTQEWHGLHRHHALLPFRLWWRTKSIRRTTLVKLVLEIFFAVMVIYVPIYLRILEFEWSELGVMFMIMLLPFVLLEWPAGKLADKFLGEKELMVIGFILMGGALVIMPSLGKVFIAWTLALLISRIGASLVEVTAESYFFKHVNESDTRLISIFRLARPAGIIIGSGLGIASVSLFSFEKIFLLLAVAVFLGLKESLAIKDTL